MFTFCLSCGSKNAVGIFCRRCGGRLAPPLPQLAARTLVPQDRHLWLATAAVAGLGYRSHWRLPVRLVMLALGVTVIHLMGIAWLQLVMSTPISFATHVAPFVVGDVLKVAFVLLLGSGLRTPIQRSWLT